MIGSKTTVRGKCKDISIAVNEDALVEILERIPLAGTLCGPH
jgi:hypothetical protein